MQKSTSIVIAMLLFLFNYSAISDNREISPYQDCINNKMNLFEKQGRLQTEQSMELALNEAYQFCDKTLGFRTLGFTVTPLEHSDPEKIIYPVITLCIVLILSHLFKRYRLRCRHCSSWNTKVHSHAASQFGGVTLLSCDVCFQQSEVHTLRSPRHGGG